MTDHLASLKRMIGKPRDLFLGIDEWDRLENDLGVTFPGDYKSIINSYAPVRMNHHLYLDHPANTFCPLGSWISRIISTFQSMTWPSGTACPGFESTGPQFGGESGMIPIASTDRGEYAFLVPGKDGGQGTILTRGREEPDFYAHNMSFGEWLHRYLAGEEMFVPGVTARYPGPLAMMSLPTSADDRPVTWYGPAREI
ncbi:SMI1/KNR4 family protein [Streptomyces sp. NPDC059456]|uniref:SMI1/KNR4 family protein n=1 Tax=Streptomyces sp. NPDC059456 TaxID=3346838 RepID=UPI0036784C54